MNILVLNCGSSTIKFEVIEIYEESLRSDTEKMLVRGLLDRLGPKALLSCETDKTRKTQREIKASTIQQGLQEILQNISCEIHAVGHRVVHGGEIFSSSVRIDPKVLTHIESCIDLAPLHNPANVQGILAAQEQFGKDIPHVAVFDTAFHSALPKTSFLYGLPYELYEKHKIRRYGFHGSSHRYVAYRYQKLRNLSQEEVNIIVLHLGSGCSVCAVKNGKSFDTSMGLTPLEGLIMSTRCGDLDPSIPLFLQESMKMSIEQTDAVLNRKSGLLGVSGRSADMRDLLKQKDERCQLAIDLFCYRIQKYIGAYLAGMGGAQAIIFTAGIGENSPHIRARVCRPLGCIGLKLDPMKNESVTVGDISQVSSTLAAYVIPTHEEFMIARDTFCLATGLSPCSPG